MKAMCISKGSGHSLGWVGVHRSQEWAGVGVAVLSIG